MPEVLYWNDEAARQAFIEKGRVVLERIAGELGGSGGVVAIEPESGAYFWGATLGQANDAASSVYPDMWMYFVRMDDPTAEIALPTW